MTSYKKNLFQMCIILKNNFREENKIEYLAGKYAFSFEGRGAKIKIYFGAILKNYFCNNFTRRFFKLVLIFSALSGPMRNINLLMSDCFSNTGSANS